MSLSNVAPAMLVGQSEAHLCNAEDEQWIGARIHAEVVEPLRALRAAASGEGFDVAVLSGFRGFDRQLSIWNRKARGELPVLDSAARPMDITTLSERELAFAILRWSALPGASRHHWGTDLDIYDIAAKPAGYVVDLVPAEVEAGGMFAPMHEWLDARIEEGDAFGFFRPYDADRGGVAPERWHLSYEPLSSLYMELLTPDVLRLTIEPADMLLKGAVLGALDEIFERFVINTSPGGGFSERHS